RAPGSWWLFRQVVLQSIPARPRRSFPARASSRCLERPVDLQERSAPPSGWRTSAACTSRVHPPVERRRYGREPAPLQAPTERLPRSLQIETCHARTARFTSSAILASSSGPNPFTAKAVGHMLPSSRCAESLKPNVAYRVPNLSAAWKKQTTLPSWLA